MNAAKRIILGGQSNKYILDNVKSYTAASYSTARRLRSGQLLAMRIRRSNDNAEIDIGFVGKNLDTASITAFCGSNSGYVTTLYDQSGKGNHAIQADATKQPRIVNAGIIDRDFDATKCNALYPTFASASGVNLNTNGNLINSTGYTSTYSTFSVSDNTAIVTGNGGGTGSFYLRYTSTVTPITGRRIYYRAKIKVTNNVSTKIDLAIFGSTGGGTSLGEVLNPVRNTVYTLSGVTVFTGYTGVLLFDMRSYYADAATANGKVMEVQEVVCIDITELGQPTMYLDGSNDCLQIPAYPSSAQAALLYPTFASASGVNIVTNGNFSNADGWTGNEATLAVSDNTMSIIGNGLGAYPQAFLSTSVAISVGKRFFISLKVRVTNPNCLNIGVIIDGTTAGTNTLINAIATPTQNQWYTVNAIGVAGADFTGNVKILLYHQYTNTATANEKVMEVQELVCVDVTAMWNLNITTYPIFLNTIFNSQCTANSYVFAKNFSAADLQYAQTHNVDSLMSRWWYDESISLDSASNSIAKDVQKITTAVLNSGNQQGYINGAISGNPQTRTTALTSRPNMFIGARSSAADGSTQAANFKGYITELHIMRGNPKREKLELDQKKYYGIA